VTEKFNQEKEHLEVLLKQIDYQDWKITKPPSDPPDLIIKKKHDTLAIEHTRLYINNTKAQETEWKNLMLYCQKSIEEIGIANYIVRITPNDECALTKNRRSYIRMEIIKIILENIESVGTEKVLIALNPFPEIKTIKAFKRTGHFLISFDSREWWSNAAVTTNKLIEIVRSKSEKITDIDVQEFRQVWLLVVLEGQIFSDSPKLNRTDIIPNGLNKFDRIFMLHLEDEWFQEIKNCA